MKGDKKVIDTLNSLLADELTAINQYTVHAEMCENWGYDGLHKAIRDRTITEMRHVDRLIDRILFLEGKPIVSELRKITIGSDVPGQLANDLALEMGAVATYNRAILVCGDVPDFATREVLEGILTDEDGHVDWIEEQLGQIGQMGVERYLTTQTRE